MSSIFNRVELKYLLPYPIFSQFRKNISPFIVEDGFSKKADGYIVNSLYFDSPKKAFFHQVMESEDMRKKVRLRFYSDTPSKESAYFEIKEKKSQYIYKKRSLINKDIASTTILNDKISNQSLEKNIQNHSTSFLSLNTRYDLRRSLWVRYHRKAFTSAIHKFPVRITFDSEIFAARPNFPSFSKETHSRILDSRLVLLEIKTDSGIPTWLKNAIQNSQLQRNKFSKYATSVIRLGV